RTIPYGLACIAGCLEAHGFTVEIVDGLATSKSRIRPWPEEMTYLGPHYGRADVSPFALFHQYRHFGYSFSHLAELVRQSGAFLVGISALFTPYQESALALAVAIKKLHPACHIVVGGHHATALPEMVMQCAAVDYVLRGEGEIAMLKLAAAHKEGWAAEPDRLKEIPGIVFRCSDGRLHISEPALIIDPDSQPLPATHLLKNSFYMRKAQGSAVVMASRGCPLRCSYCAVSAECGLPYRRRGVDSVLREIENAVCQDNVGFVDFEDENLTIDRDWFMTLIAGIAKLRQGRDFELRAMNGLYPPSLDEAMIGAMREAGFKTLNLAVGSFDSAQLKQFRRPDVGRAHDRVVELCQKHGLKAVSYIIAGAPGQSAETSLADILRLARQDTIVGLSVFYPAPGSLDYRRADELGILPAQLSLLRSSALPLDHTTSRLETATLLRLSRILNFIKFLQENRRVLPELRPYWAADFSSQAVQGSCSERSEIGLLLLSYFFADGVIRGMTAAGEIYAQPTALALTRKFMQEFLPFAGQCS
ncbi:MAG: B12-binding domain-containing radical SAM protein, partial [Deltaproteobacteria bacterium]|nr:B12-binding domain-containing radical SAM protein [Deltaproteobacteria bacterium]